LYFLYQFIETKFNFTKLLISTNKTKTDTCFHQSTAAPLQNRNSVIGLIQDLTTKYGMVIIFSVINMSMFVSEL